MSAPKFLTYDGGSWTDLTSVYTSSSDFAVNHFYEYGGELFVSGYDLDTYTYKAISYDGSSWTDITSDTGNNIYDFIEYKGELFANGSDSDGSNDRLLQYDGGIWTDISSDVSITNVSQTHEYNDKLFVSAYDEATSESKLLTYDGVNWTDITSGMGLSDPYVSGFYAYNDEFIVGARDANDSTYHLLTYDGSTWTNVTDNTGYSSFYSYVSNSYEYGGNLFLGGNTRGGSIDNRSFIYDGSTWTNITDDTGSSDLSIAKFYEFEGKLITYGVVTVGGSSSTRKLLTYGNESVAAGSSSSVGVGGEYGINFSANSSYGVASKDIRSSSIDLDISSLDFSVAGSIDTLAKIDTAIGQVEAYERQLSTSSVLIQTRLDFTENMVSAYTSMYDNLTLVDVNEEAANLMSLQIQQELMMNTLSFTMSSQANLLSLFQ
ncbi:MAG: hypothetical protein ACTSXQ_01170 [Alphaproteobacteria bacterium]